MCKSIEIPQLSVFSFTEFRRSLLTSPALGDGRILNYSGKTLVQVYSRRYFVEAMRSEGCDKSLLRIALARERLTHFVVDKIAPWYDHRGE